MKTAIGSISIAGVAFSLIIISAASAQAAAAPAPTTLWNFLGIPQGVNKVRDALVNRRGERPGMERKDPLKRIADPANLESEVPAIKAAAEIKADSDLAKQKIKAIKYLSDVGCGCSSQKADVQEALLAALDDCTEEVRYEAALAFCRASGNPCSDCGATCCGEDVEAKLKDMAFGQDDDACWKERSSRVRAAAKNALNACELVAGPTEPAPPEEIRERPVERPVEQTTSVPRSFDPSIETVLRRPLSSLQPAPGNVKPAGYSLAGETEALRASSALRQPNSAQQVDPQARFRGTVITSSK